MPKFSHTFDFSSVSTRSFYASSSNNKKVVINGTIYNAAVYSKPVKDRKRICKEINREIRCICF
jgi:hypothetical protein